jgi:hypothetical protein
MYRFAILIAVSALIASCTDFSKKSLNDEDVVKRYVDLPSHVSELQAEVVQRTIFVKFNLDSEQAIAFANSVCDIELHANFFPFEPTFTPPNWWTPETVDESVGGECSRFAVVYEILIETRSETSTLYLRISPT